MNDALKAFLCEKFGLPTDADEAATKKLAAEKLASGELPHDKYLELITPKAAELSPLDKLVSAIASKLNIPAQSAASQVLTAEQVQASAAATVNAHGLGQAAVPDSQVTPEKLFAPAAAAAASGAHGQPRVKRASEKYGTTKSRKVYPQFLGGRDHGVKHPMAGLDATVGGTPAYDQSEVERAKSGAFQRFLIQRSIREPLMTDEDTDLLMESLEKDLWVGDAFSAAGPNEYQRPKHLSELQKKTFLSDSASGGSSLVPYYFDMDLVTYPKLNGELFPFVDLKDLNETNQVKTPTLNNLTVSAGPSEGDSPGITLQTTTGLAAVLTSNVLNATGAITVGRDFLTDSPLALQDELMKSYQRVLSNFLDQQIAAGDGTTFILGIFNTSSTKTYTAQNSTAGPVTVKDVKAMIFALPAEYRKQNLPTFFVGVDALYSRIRGIVTGLSGDQRLVYGYNFEDYSLENHPFKITDSSSVSGSQLAFGRMDKYRMWRRKGMTFEASTQGKTLMTANEAIITMRSRWAGQVIDPNAWVLGSGFSLH